MFVVVLDTSIREIAYTLERNVLASGDAKAHSCRPSVSSAATKIFDMRSACHARHPESIELAT